VAWEAPQQPLATFWVLLALWLAAQAYVRRPRLALGLSLAAYGAGLLFQESALPFVFAFFWLAAEQARRSLARRGPVSRRALAQFAREHLAWRPGAGGLPLWWPLLHLAVAAAFALIWLSVPRKANVTGEGFDLTVLGYLFQGVVFPLAHGLTRWIAGWPTAALTALFAALSAVVAALVARWTSARAALLALAWLAAGLLPVWAGLSWEYVRISSRVFYPAVLGIAVLWAGLIVWLVSDSGWRRAVGAGAALSLLSLSVWQGQQFTRLYDLGTRHLGQTVDLLGSNPAGRYVFVNYPDRIELRPGEAYPLGNWGLVLAPVVQKLADYAAAAGGRSAADTSLAVFAADVPDRAAWPYRVDMRGSDTAPQGLLEAAAQADGVYLTDYEPGGQLVLRELGAIRPGAAGAAPLAQWGDAVQLVEAEVLSGRRPALRLVWVSRQPLPADTTVFVHLWQQESAFPGADGDSLGGLVPLPLWPPGSTIVDVRALDRLPYPPGDYEVRVGLYQRASLERLPALAADGARYWGDEVPVGTVTLP
jgi:hypothetical protein